jgi:hypothetical protein
MSHFAELDSSNKVLRVLVVPDEFENNGQDYLANDIGLGGNWIKTSYNNNIRKQYAGIGYKYDSVNDVFIVPQPYPSWILNENFDWQAPTPYPEGEESYNWNESTLSWDLVE